MTEHTNLQERLAAALSALDRMTDQRDQLAAQLKDATAPEGWQLVPTDPDIKMLAAFVEAGGKAISGYKAMLAAAPKPEDQ